MSINKSSEENELTRSNFIQDLIQHPDKKLITSSSIDLDVKIPKIIVQFWDNLNRLPEDVNKCIETWKELEAFGFKRFLFDKNQAGEFINKKLGSRYKRAYDKCYHPAMQSDYFRLCYIFVEGGCYIDTDDIYFGTDIQHLFDDGRLKIQPLCYDIATHGMIPQKIFTKEGINNKNWIFYFNNNPLITIRNHPIIEYALNQATLSLEKALSNDFLEIQSTAGPGNLTKSIYDCIKLNEAFKKTILVLSDWEDIAESKWELSYRNDSRNWRLSNCKFYKEE